MAGRALFGRIPSISVLRYMYHTLSFLTDAVLTLSTKAHVYHISMRETHEIVSLDLSPSSNTRSAHYHSTDNTMLSVLIVISALRYIYHTSHMLMTECHISGALLYLRLGGDPVTTVYIMSV